MKAKTICLVYPWFGKLNSYFNLWLESAINNDTIDFLIYTDKENADYIKKTFTLTGNIKIFTTSLLKIAEKMSHICDAPIGLISRPYKLCDYKPFYCYIFEETKKYDYWGFGDMDVILGDIRHFLTDEVLEKNDVIGNMGHLQIMHNIDSINKLVFLTQREYLLQVVCDLENNYCFDEKEHSRFNLLNSDRKLLIWDDVADVRKPSRGFGLKYFRFTFPCDVDNKHHKQSCYYNRHTGKLYLTKIINGKLVSKEVIYLHLQKRKMKNCIHNMQSNILCLPNRFIECSTESDIRRKYRFYLLDFLKCEWANKKSYFRHLIARIKHKH